MFIVNNEQKEVNLESHTHLNTDTHTCDIEETGSWRRKLQEQGRQMEEMRLKELKEGTVAKYSGYITIAVEILVRRIPKERGGGFTFPFFTQSRFDIVSLVFAARDKTRAGKTGGVKCSTITFAGFKNAWDQAAEAERCCDTWLLMPWGYNTAKLDLDVLYFHFGGGKRKPASSTLATARQKKSVGMIAAKAAHEAGVPSTIKATLWAQPTKTEWRNALQWLSKYKQISILSHLLLCRQGCQRPIDMSRLSIADLMSSEAGDRELGNHISYLAFLPEGGKMMGIGQHTLGGVARARDYATCAVFFAALRLFAVLVFDPSDERKSSIDLSSMPWEEWRQVLMFPASDLQSHMTHRGQFSATVKQALKKGAGVNEARMHGFNMCTEPRSQSCMALFAAEAAWEHIQIAGSRIHTYAHTHMHHIYNTHLHPHLAVCLSVCVTYIYNKQVTGLVSIKQSSPRVGTAYLSSTTTRHRLCCRA